jgi:adenosine deaminase
LTNELLQCSDAFAWDWENIGNVAKNAIYHSFLPQSDKDKLFMKLKAWEEANEIFHQGM